MRPLRTCIGCHRKAAADELVRVAAEPGGGVAIGRHLPGRGAWLCAGSGPCFEAAARRKGFARALRTDIRPEALAAVRASFPGRARMERQAIVEKG